MTYAPALAVLPSVAYVEYGKVPSMYLGPCTAISDASSRTCSAFALGLTVYGDGRRTATDLTGSIAVRPLISCRRGVGGHQQCTTCTMEMLHLARGCLPGTYSFRRVIRIPYSKLQIPNLTRNCTATVYGMERHRPLTLGGRSDPPPPRSGPHGASGVKGPCFHNDLICSSGFRRGVQGGCVWATVSPSM